MFICKNSWNIWVLLIYSLLKFAVSQNAKSDISKEGDSLLSCSELTNIAEIARCLTKGLKATKHKTTSGSYGYPFNVAPALPAFFKHEPDHPPISNSIEGATRRIDSQTIQRRMQGYSVPQYRNFLDLDSTVSHRAVEYRPIFEVYTVPVTPPEKDILRHPLQRFYQQTYAKPVKTHTKEYGRRLKQGKIPGQSNSQILYKHTSYDAPAKYDRNKVSVEGKKFYPKTQTYKYDLDQEQYSKENGYDAEYYVPANSPIMGDIRRSLLDYTGARDIMEDEPDYLGSVGIRRFKALEIQPDYYPFRRRSDTNVKDLDISKRKPN